MKKVLQKKQFKKDFKTAIARGKDPQKLTKFLELYLSNKDIPEKYKLHPLRGNWKDHWDCHLEPDWLLLFTDVDDIVTLVRTGSHSDLF